MEKKGGLTKEGGDEGRKRSKEKMKEQNNGRMEGMKKGDRK